MFYLIVIIHILCMASVFWLALRWRLFESQNSLGLKHDCQYGPYHSCLILLNHQIVSADTFWESASANCVDKPLHYLEPNEAYSTVEELIEWIVRQAPPGSIIALKPVIKAFYQVQCTFQWPPSSIQALLNPIVREMNRIEETGDGESIRAEYIHPGQQIDLKTMQPVNEGTIVKQPFGIVIMKGDKVISKAKVQCR